MSSTKNTPLSSTNSGSLGSTSSTIKQLSVKLTQWRGLLPHELRWSDNNPATFPTPQPTNPDNFKQPLDPSLSPSVNNSGFALFTADLDSEPEFYPYIFDVQVALLRTRYYYTKYLVHQPFVYKALHFPEHLTEEDAQGVAECLQVCKRGVLVSYRILNSSPVVLTMADCPFSDFPSETVGAIPLRLVADVP